MGDGDRDFTFICNCDGLEMGSSGLMLTDLMICQCKSWNNSVKVALLFMWAVAARANVQKLSTVNSNLLNLFHPM